LKHGYELSYEDYVGNPGKYHREIAKFIGTRLPEPPKEDKFYHVTQWRNPLGLRVPENAMEDVTGAHNQKYFTRWSDLLNNSALRCYYQYIAVQYEPKFMTYGYSLMKGFNLVEEWRSDAERISAGTGSLYCAVANVNAFTVRLPRQVRGYIKRQLRTHLPASIKVRIQRLLQKNVSHQKPAGHGLVLKEANQPPSRQS